jgi:hypothetical protein
LARQRISNRERVNTGAKKPDHHLSHPTRHHSRFRLSSSGSK